MFNVSGVLEFQMAGRKPSNSAHTAVLIVEDNALIALDLETIMLNCGVGHVQIAATVPQALALIEAETFHAALLDVRVRETLTLPVATALRAAGTPFAFVTGYDAGGDMLDGFKSQTLITKPYAEQQICDVLTTLLMPEQHAS
jgi:CheY-like chemotaxis protein